MRLRWSPRAQADLVRLHRFLAPKSQRAAKNMLRDLRAGSRRLLELPRLGERIESIDHIEARRIFISGYELRYQVLPEEIRVLRIWHTRENR